MATDYVRKQVILDKTQSDQMNQIAKNEGITFSELVRKYINSQLRIRTYQQMQRAADVVFEDYSTDADLTDMTALDGEQVIDG